MQAAIIDACALINLINCGGAEEILEACGVEVWVQGLVEDEVVDGGEALGELVQRGLLRQYDGAKLVAVAVRSIIVDHDLGVGEAECIAICLESGLRLISDDRRARIAAAELLGEASVMGTIGLLCFAIDSGGITSTRATALLAQARRSGGFLPNFDFETRQLVA